MSKEVLLRKLQALNLIAVDLQLFLDTHPGNKEALEDNIKNLEKIMNMNMDHLLTLVI